MTQGYYAGISGLVSNQYGLDVVSDNLANVSTTGFKSSSTEFADLFTQALVSSNGSATPTSDDLGVGVRLQVTSFDMAQGALMPSDRATDLALQGNGWFGVRSNNQDYFTRDGSFTLDASQSIQGDVNSSTSHLVNGDGMYVTGTMLANFAYNATMDYGDTTTSGVSGAYVLTNPTFDVPLNGAGEQGNLEFPTRLAYPVTPTTQAKFFGNLGIDPQVRTISTDLISSSNEKNGLQLTFTQSATQPTEGIAWDVVATVTSHDGTTIYDTQKGQVNFGTSGELKNSTLSSVNNDGSPVTINLGSDFSGLISTAGMGVSSSSQSDGIAGGTLTKYNVSSDGTIIADFSNGKQSAIGRVAVYHFQNDQGLNRNGGTYYEESSNSGKPVFWTDAAGNATAGAIVQSGRLEASNVRVDVGLTDMIIMQRSYQANSKTITTVDEMIQKALQMHR